MPRGYFGASKIQDLGQRMFETEMQMELAVAGEPLRPEVEWPERWPVHSLEVLATDGDVLRVDPCDLTWTSLRNLHLLEMLATREVDHL